MVVASSQEISRGSPGLPFTKFALFETIVVTSPFSKCPWNDTGWLFRAFALSADGTSALPARRRLLVFKSGQHEGSLIAAKRGLVSGTNQKEVNATRFTMLYWLICASFALNEGRARSQDSLSVSN